MRRMLSELDCFIRDNKLMIVIVMLLFLAGTVLGALYSRSLVRYQLDELTSSLDLYLEIFSEAPPGAGQVFLPALVNGIRFAFLIWLLGMVAVGFPFTVFLIILKGFSLGFTIGLLVRQMGLKGFLFALASLLPQNLIYIPLQVIIAVAAITFSWFLFRSRFAKESRVDYGYSLRHYTLLQGLLALGLIAGAVVESYITPVLIRVILPYI